jgi:hypothetical protein
MDEPRIGSLHAAFPDRFVNAMADDKNAFALQAGAWKFDFENLTKDEILDVVRLDNRPRYCAAAFPALRNFQILELGPGDGYHTLGLDLVGARNVIAIESNARAFLRCLILKNAFGLRAKFLLGDFLQYVAQPGVRADLIYASGVLYHLADPVAFLMRCPEIAPNLFLWTHYYDISECNDFERACFDNDRNEIKRVGDVEFTYHRRELHPSVIRDPKYQAGLGDYGNWMSRDDVFRALDFCGYRVINAIDDYLDNGLRAAAITLTVNR